MAGYRKICTGIMFVLGLHQIITGIIHAYTEKIIMEKKDLTLAVMWTLAALGNRQLFLGVWEMMVAFDWGGIKQKTLRPLLGLHAIMGFVYKYSPLIHGRVLSAFSPNAPGNFLPNLLLLLTIVGYVLAVLDQRAESADSAAANEGVSGRTRSKSGSKDD
jgi:hypothetical protein